MCESERDDREGGKIQLVEKTSSEKAAVVNFDLV